MTTETDTNTETVVTPHEHTTYEATRRALDALGVWCAVFGGGGHRIQFCVPMDDGNAWVYDLELAVHLAREEMRVRYRFNPGLVNVREALEALRATAWARNFQVNQTLGDEERLSRDVPPLPEVEEMQRPIER